MRNLEYKLAVLRYNIHYESIKLGLIKMDKMLNDKKNCKHCGRLL